MRSRRDFSWIRTALHAGVWLATVSLLLYLRHRIGDPRVGDALGNPVEVTQRIVQALFLGPKTVVDSLIMRPLNGLWASNGLQWVVILLCGLAFYLHAHGTNPKTSERQQGDGERPR